VAEILVKRELLSESIASIKTGRWGRTNTQLAARTSELCRL